MEEMWIPSGDAHQIALQRFKSSGRGEKTWINRDNLQRIESHFEDK
ncbi:MAG: hypothetical protein AAF939_12925 [Planctomycetota bacterium]